MGARKEVTESFRKDYHRAKRKEKTVFLDEFVKRTGYDRKYAVKLLRKRVKEVLLYENGGAVKVKVEKRRRPANRRGKKKYDEAFAVVLRRIWSFFWYKCGKILSPLLRQQMPFIADWPAFGINAEIRLKLLEVSPATIDRILKKDKAELKLKGKSCTKSVHHLKNHIPIRTFYTSAERKTPGFIQTDTVHHCGSSTGGEYLLTLTATDVFSGWVILRGLLNKAWKWTFDALSDVRATLPFPFLEYHSDNGSEFINDAVDKWCENEHVPFTRSRSHKKNDNCFVEQKNDKCVREYIGYDRMTTNDQLALLNSVYPSLEPLLDFFMPTMKLLSKVKVGSKEIKKYDKPVSPYHRLMESSALSRNVKDSLQQLYRLYNPVLLQNDVNKAVSALRQANLKQSIVNNAT
jgi:transposase InsO family protein